MRPEIESRNRKIHLPDSVQMTFNDLDVTP